MSTLDEILSGSTTAPAAETQEATTQPVAETQQAEQTPEQQAEAPAEGETSKDGKPIPVGAIRQAERDKADKRYTAVLDNLRQENAERDAAWERRMAKLLETVKPPAPPQQAPDIWENPDAFVEQRTQPLQQAILQQREQFSHIMAAEKHGSEVVEAAYAELKKRIEQNPQAAQADYTRIMRSPHPFGELVKWHQSQQAIAEIGPDPAAYKAKLEAEIRAQLAAETQPDAQARVAPNDAASVMPSNLASARNVGARSGPAWGGPRPIADIFATGRK